MWSKTASMKDYTMTTHRTTAPNEKQRRHRMRNMYR
jgi:hypothetical protein